MAAYGRGMDGIDAIRLNFGASSLRAINFALAVIMYGVALDLRWSDFRRLFARPIAPLVGLGCQFFLLPAFGFWVAHRFAPSPSMALGIMLVCACPGGTTSNFFTHLALGRTATSVGMTAVSTTVALVALPVNFRFWGGLSASTGGILSHFELSLGDMLSSVGLLLLLPTVLGMWTAARFATFASRARPWFMRASLVFFFVLVGVAFAKNVDVFLRYIHLVVVPVTVTHGGAMVLGYGLGWVLRCDEADRRAIAIEVGIQNTGLALVLIFSFFGGMGGMAFVAGWWGIWHLLSGLTVALLWRRFPPAMPRSLARSTAT